MSDGIFDGIFPIVHRTFLLSYFRGCRLLGFFFVLKVCGHIMKRLSSWRCPFVFLKRRLRYNSMAISFVTKLNFWWRKLYKIRLDSFLYSSWFTATINTIVCSSKLFSTDLARHQYPFYPVNAYCLCSSIFWKIAEFTSLFYQRTAYNGVVYQWCYWFCFSRRRSDSARSNNFARSFCVSLRSKQRLDVSCSVSI